MYYTERKLREEGLVLGIRGREEGLVLGVQGWEEGGSSLGNPREGGRRV